MAGITFLEQFQEPALRGLVDATEEARVDSVFDGFLPNDTSYDMSFTYDVIKKTNHIAAMIGYGAEPPVIDRDQVATKFAEGAKFGLKYIATEEELLALNQARSSGEKAAMVDKLTVKAIDLLEAMNRRIQLIKAQAIVQGEFDYNKNGAKMTVDFGIADADTSSDWTDENTDVIGALLEWTKDYEDENGVSPSVILMSREAQALLLKNSVIVAEAGRPDGVGRVSVDQLNSVLGGYGLPSVQVVTNRSITVRNEYTGEDETIEYFPKGRVVMLSQGIGNFVFTPTVEANFQPAMDLRAYDKFEPIQSIIRVAAAGFPVIESPSLIFHADIGL